MNKIMFCLLLLPILLAGVCAVSASSDVDADVSDVGLYSSHLDDHVGIEPISGIRPVTNDHIGSERPVNRIHADGIGVTFGPNILNNISNYSIDSRPSFMDRPSCPEITPIEEIQPISSDTELPILDGNFTDDNGSVPVVPIIIIDYGSNNQSSDRPSSDVPVAEVNSLSTILPQRLPASIVEASSADKFPPFRPNIGFDTPLIKIKNYPHYPNVSNVPVIGHTTRLPSPVSGVSNNNALG